MNPSKIPKFCIKQSTDEIVICKKSDSFNFKLYKKYTKINLASITEFDVFLVINQNNWTNSRDECDMIRHWPLCDDIWPQVAMGSVIEKLQCQYIDGHAKNYLNIYVYILLRQAYNPVKRYVSVDLCHLWMQSVICIVCVTKYCDTS